MLDLFELTASLKFECPQISTTAKTVFAYNLDASRHCESSHTGATVERTSTNTFDAFGQLNGGKLNAFSENLSTNRFEHIIACKCHTPQCRTALKRIVPDRYGIDGYCHCFQVPAVSKGTISNSFNKCR